MSSLGWKLGLVDEDQMPVSMMWALKGTRSTMAAISLVSVKTVPHSLNGTWVERRDGGLFLPFGDHRATSNHSRFFCARRLSRASLPFLERRH